MTTVPEQTSADLAQFVAPGLLHRLGNSLFSIQGHAQMLRGTEAEIAREKGAIQKASEKALNALQIFRYLIAEPDAAPAPQAGILLHRLCDYLRIPMRERGLSIQFEHGSSETPVGVNGTTLCQVVVGMLRHLVGALPCGFEGRVTIDLVSQGPDGLTLSLRVETSPSFLPFPVHLEDVVRHASALLELHSVRVEASGDQQTLRLRVPARPNAVGDGDGRLVLATSQ